MEIKSFKDFGIKPSSKSFIGKSIKISKILNKEITVHAFKIEDSKIKKGTKFLSLQISISGDKHVIFTGSSVLMDAIVCIPEDGFPFLTTIVENDERYEFT